MAISELSPGKKAVVAKTVGCHDGRCGRDMPACCIAQLDSGAQKLTGPTCGRDPVIAGTMDDPRVIEEFREDATALD